MAVQADTPGRLFTVENWPHGWPSNHMLRHLIQHSASNGLDRHGAILRLGKRGRGRRVVIDERAFLEWARAEGREGAA